MEFQVFDAKYIRQLAEGDRRAQEHFAAYFGELMHIKLRGMVRSLDMIEDIRQETFRRVLEAVRRPGGIERPERLGAYVCSVCRNVALEAFRNGARHTGIDRELDERADSRVDLDAPLVNHQRRQVVEEVLAELSKRDQRLLRMIFLDETEKEEVCRQLRVAKDYLRVVLHRAKSRFRDKLAERKDSAA